jgi:hypothetical protein
MISEEEWLAFMDDLQQTLNKFGVASTGAGRNQGNCGEYTRSNHGGAAPGKLLTPPPQF